jgi:hypothetical protein
VGAAVQFGADASTLIVDSGATFVGQVTANSAVTDTLELADGGNGGTGITLGTQFTGFSTLEFAPGATDWTVDATVAALQTHAPGQSDFTVDGFSMGDTIDVADAAGATLRFNSTTEVLTLTEGGGTEVNLQFDSPFNGEHFVLKGQDLQLAAGACFRSGTRIRCEHGEVAIESLQIGDRVLTAAGTLQPVRWIGRRRHTAEEAFANRAILPVRIRAGALGSDVPVRDLWVSPEHAMYIDAMLIPAAALINGTSIVQEETSAPVVYLHLEFDSHTIIYAEGAVAESFVDDDSRQMFDNAPEYHILYPGAAAARACFCAPRVEDGEELERVRHRLSHNIGRLADSLVCLAATGRPVFESARP